MKCLPPIKKIFSIINSCTHLCQLSACKKLAENYTRMAKDKEIVNYNLIHEILFIKIKEKANELRLSNKFKGKIRRRKIKIMDAELELASNFGHVG